VAEPGQPERVEPPAEAPRPVPSAPRVSDAERRTEYQPALIATGLVLAIAGAIVLCLAVSREGAWSSAVPQLVASLFGWGALVAAIRGIVTAAHPAHVAIMSGRLLITGGLLWALGCVVAALGVRRSRTPVPAPSAAVGAPLYPPLARYQDFTWSTLFAYGGGILLAELVLIVLQTVLAGGRTQHTGLPPVAAFGISGLCAAAVAFGAGFLGAARAQRLAAPEATIGLLYFGLPIPALLTAIPMSAWLSLNLGFRLREVIYLAGLLGRAELGYWLIFCLLVVMMVLGITSGFVATGSGRVDLRAGYELFISRRHVAVFRPRLLVGVLTVLLFGIVPPLILYAMLRAAEATVERSRIRKLGLADPLRASEALAQWKSREQSPTAMMTALSVGGVGVGVMALIIVLSVMSGFEADLQKKILGSNADAVVTSYDGPIDDWQPVMKKIGTVGGVTGETPFIMNQVMLASDQNIDGVIIKGIDPSTVGKVTDLPKNVLPGGSIDNLVHPEKIEPHRIGGAPVNDPLISMSAGKEQTLPGILIGRELAANLKVMVGDRLNVVSPLGGELGPQGPTPKSRPFRVAGVFYTGMFEYDSKFAYIELHEAETFFGLKGVTGVEIKVANVDDARRIAREVVSTLDGYPYRARDWGEMNHNLFSALALEKLVMGIILSMIVIVAAGLIVATVIMLVLEKRKEISVLKALGVSDGGILKIFLSEGLQIGIAGGLLGLFSGLAWCLFIEKVGLQLDPEVYYIPNLPVKIEPLQTALSVVIAVLVTFMASVYPALRASRIDPVEGLKAE
jgi:lipoprotein-releasing system permease protein